MGSPDDVSAKILHPPSRHQPPCRLLEAHHLGARDLGFWLLFAAMRRGPGIQPQRTVYVSEHGRRPYYERIQYNACPTKVVSRGVGCSAVH